MVLAFAGDSTMTSGFAMADTFEVGAEDWLFLGSRVADRSPPLFSVVPWTTRRCQTVAEASLSVHGLTSPAVLALNWLDPRDLIDTFGAAGLLLVVFIESGLVNSPARLGSLPPVASSRTCIDCVASHVSGRSTA